MTSQGGGSPTSADWEAPSFFPEPAIDRLTGALLKLTGEVWVLTERVAVLEALATRRGLALEAELAQFTFSPEEDARLQEARAEFVRAVLGPLSAKGG
jgi:hypothetical protein